MNAYKARLENVRKSNNYRQLPAKDTENLIDLCSNDYLGINDNELLRREFLETYNCNYSFGATSSRLLSKYMDSHHKFEKNLAEYYKNEAALLYNSGYHANVGILSALPQKNDLIIADKYIHASAIDGARLSSANFMRYRHLNYEHLEQLLKRHRNNYENVFIVSESVFSMDGDIADIEKLIVLKNKYNCYLYIDEAHALGIYGKQGLGLVSSSDNCESVDFIVGALGKTVASIGGFVICKSIFAEYLVNHSRSFIYSTALPPINVAWSMFIFKKMMSMDAERQQLKSLSKQFATLLNIQAESHIIPYIVGDNDEAISASLLLKQEGYNVLPIRFPTVPKGRARLRFSLNASMSIEKLKPIELILSKHNY